MLSREFAWIYCHGPVLWQMTPEEMARYHGSYMDTTSTVENLDEYFAVTSERLLLSDPAYAEDAEIVRNHGDLDYDGIPPAWWHVGPFPCGGGEFTMKYPPEMSIAPNSGGIDFDRNLFKPVTATWTALVNDIGQVVVFDTAPAASEVSINTLTGIVTLGSTHAATSSLSVKVAGEFDIGVNR